MTVEIQSSGPQQHLDLPGFAGHQSINQLIGNAQLNPIACQSTIHSEAMTPVLSLIHISRCPGAFEEHNVTGTVEREAKSTRSIGGQQHIVDARLKAIDDGLTLHRLELASQQLSADPLLQEP